MDTEEYSNAIYKSIYRNDFNMFKNLIDTVDVDSIDNYGIDYDDNIDYGNVDDADDLDDSDDFNFGSYSIVLMTISFNRLNFVEYLIEKGINLNKKYKGFLPLKEALLDNNIKMVTLLSENGANFVEINSCSNNCICGCIDKIIVLNNIMMENYCTIKPCSKK
jgi:hypothetical protein